MADNARVLSGSGQYGQRTLPTGLSVDATWTFGAWIKPDTFGVDGRGIFSYGPANDITRGILFYLDATGMMRVRANGGAFVEGPDTAPSTSAWSTISLRNTYDGLLNFEFGLNGLSESGGAMDPVTAPTGTDVFRLGGGNASFGIGEYDGSIAWAFWLQGVALTPAQVNTYLNNPQSLYNAYGPSGSVTANALKLFWPCQRNDGTTETDVSGQANHGTWTGATFGTGTGPSPSTPWDPYGGGGDPDDPPTAGFTTSVNLKTVTVTSTAMPGTNPITYTTYNWGDGTTNTNTSRTYATGGTYTITQTVSDGTLTDQTSTSVTTKSQYTYRVTTTDSGAYAETTATVDDA